MDARRHVQEGALAPSGNVVMYLCAVIVTAKRSDELLNYLHNKSSAWLLSFAIKPPPESHHWIALGDFCPQNAQTPNLPTPGKNPAGDHAPSILLGWA